MGKIERIQLPRSGTATPMYSDAVRFGDNLSISGLLPIDEAGNLVGKDDAAAQTEQIFKNMKTVLDAAGATFEQVVKVNIYLVDIKYRGDIAPIRQKYFGDQKPSSTLVEVSRFAHPDALLEIEALVYLG